MEHAQATEDVFNLHDSTLAFEFRELFTTILREAFEDLGRGLTHRRHAFDWFTSDAHEPPTAFRALCDALNLEHEPLRREAVRRFHEGAPKMQRRVRRRRNVTMAEPRTATFTCTKCGNAFEHTYPKGFGKPAQICPACKGTPKLNGHDGERAAKPLRAQSPPRVAMGPKKNGTKPRVNGHAHDDDDVSQLITLTDEYKELTARLAEIRVEITTIAGRM